MRQNITIMATTALLLSTALLCCSDSNKEEDPEVTPTHPVVVPANAVKIPAIGNVYVTSEESSKPNYEERESAIMTSNGDIMNWNNPETVLSFYFKTSSAGELTLWVNGTAGSAGSSSKIKVTVNGTSHEVELKGGNTTYYEAGNFNISAPGYTRVDIQGLTKSGANFGDIDGIAVAGAATQGEMHYSTYDQTADAYWSRRGPSVHMNYTLPAKNVEYFYNEVTVPEGNDVNGTYFMLTGFGEGYMGIQSIADGNGGNSTYRVLFSVWSPYETDNPGDIPENMDVKILAKGDGVTAQNFGNEGSGKQSFMSYPWEAGKTYRTLVRVRPDGKGNTVYTGYFGDEKGEWHLLSQLQRPQTDTWYTRPHSFLECFNPAQSFKPRSVVFGNQWVRDNNGNWYEVTESTFTCDNTGAKGIRTDFNGGVKDNCFYLQNCGFVNETTPYGSKFKREAHGTAPVIDFEALDKLVK